MPTNDCGCCQESFCDDTQRLGRVYITLRANLTQCGPHHHKSAQVCMLWRQSPKRVQTRPQQTLKPKREVRQIYTLTCCLTHMHTHTSKHIHIHTRIMHVWPGKYGTKAARLSKKLSSDSNEQLETNINARQSSKAFPCTNPLCCRVFLSKKNLRSHLDANECQSGTQCFRKTTTPVPTDRVVDRMDFIKQHVADSLSKEMMPSRGGTASTRDTGYDGKVRTPLLLNMVTKVGE